MHSERRKGGLHEKRTERGGVTRKAYKGDGGRGQKVALKLHTYFMDDPISDALSCNDI